MKNILQAIALQGGHGLQIGGSVRDHFLNIPCKDIDIEVYGLNADQLVAILSQFGKVDAVGKSFGVIKLRYNETEYDFSLPRRENKEGQGHKGFIVEVDPNMTLVEACSRRDFTINAICYDPIKDEYLDPLNGLSDLGLNRLHPCSDHFKEDPLRVLRGMQFAARFNLLPSPACLMMCGDISHEYHTLPVERLWGEWAKWAEKSVVPSRGLDFLLSTGWIKHYSELNGLIGCEQQEAWHPEGSVWDHSKHVVNAMVEICNRENIIGEDRIVLMLAALTHDFGKPKTTEVIDGKIKSHGHAEEGVPIAEKFMQNIGCIPRIIERVLPLVQEHLVHTQKEHSFRTVRRLALRLSPASLRELSFVVEADYSGRPPLPGGLPKEMASLLDMAKDVEVFNNKPEPILMGRHLLPLGYVPGPELGRVLKAAFQAQLDGAFADVEGGLAWLSRT
jgi:tRNA nucleotidyltransferase (CCA-adding enzyme)